MPELPEVETITRRLQTVLPGKVITGVDVFKAKSFQGDTSQLTGATIVGVSRRAKILSIALSTNQFVLIHLKMTGQMIYVDGVRRLGGGHPTEEFISALPSKHTRISLTFVDGTHLYFNDQRIFGWWRIVTASGRDQELSKYAPDVISPEITTEYLIKKFANKTAPIKIAILDPSIMSGVGNIYACDGLFEARIDPRRKAGSLSSIEVDVLLKSLKMVVNQGIELGGATIQHYRTVDGLSGSYQDVRRVYAKEGEPCPECGQPIERIKQGGRSTFFCSHCQH